jgi:hypothetical protein
MKLFKHDCAGCHRDPNTASEPEPVAFYTRSLLPSRCLLPVRRTTSYLDHQERRAVLGMFAWDVGNLLEGQFEVRLVNAQHIKAVPGGEDGSERASGSPSCCNTVYCGRVLYRRRRLVTCGT